MLQNVVLLIALRYVCRKTKDQFGKYIYWIASIAVMLGVTILIIILSVMNGFERDLKKKVLYFTPHALLTTVKGYTHINDVPNVIFDKFSNIVEYTQPLVVSDVILQSAKKISFGSMLGIDPSYFEPLSNYLINDCINQLIAEKYYIILGSALAHYLEVNVNDQIRLIVPTVTHMTPVGYIPSQRLFTVSDIYMTSSEDIDNCQVLIHQLDASKLMHYPSKHYITGWRLWLRDPFVIVDDFNQLLSSNEWVWKDWREYKGSVFQAMQMEKNIMSLLLSLIIIAACFNVLSFLVLLIIEKKMEIAILQTCGFTRIRIMLIFIIQGISNGVFGITIGVGLGILLSKKLNQILSFFKILPNTLQFPIEIKSLQILIIAIMTFIIIVLITLYPSWRAASSSPAKNLYYGQ